MNPLSFQDFTVCAEIPPLFFESPDDFNGCHDKSDWTALVDRKVRAAVARFPLSTTRELSRASGIPLDLITETLPRLWKIGSVQHRGYKKCGVSEQRDIVWEAR